MKKVIITGTFEFDDDKTYLDDPESKKWFFNEILAKEKLILHSNETGDSIGTLKIWKVQKI